MKNIREYVKPVKKPDVIVKDVVPCKFRFIIGDSRNMFELPDESIDLIITSPPYFNVKDYSNLEDDIGNINNYQQYLEQMRICFEECLRVLKPGRYFALNVSDVNSDGVIYPIPFDLNVIMREVGFIYVDDIIWEKPTGVLNMKRFGVFIQNPFPLYYYPIECYEHVLIFRKQGETKRKKEIVSIDYDKIKSNIWKINPSPVRTDFKLGRDEYKKEDEHMWHDAPFPLELPYRVICLYSYKYETILDPFLGSGTTMVACKYLRRNCVGYDINPDFKSLVVTRVGFNQSSFSNDVFMVTKQDMIRVYPVAQNCPKCTSSEIAEITNSRVEFQCLSCNYSENNKKEIFAIY